MGISTPPYPPSTRSPPPSGKPIVKPGNPASLVLKGHAPISSRLAVASTTTKTSELMTIRSMISLLIIATSSASINAATISNPTFYSGLADQPSLHSTFTASSLPTKNFSYWEGLAGGQIIISLTDGEVISSVMITFASSNSQSLLESTPYSPRWTLSLSLSYPDVGFQPGDQLWKVTGNYGSSNWHPTGGYYLDTARQPLFLKARFEVVSNYGTTIDDNEGDGYFYSIVPEPSIALLTSLALIGFFKRSRPSKL